VTFDIVVAADDAWGIGKGGKMPWPRLNGDLAFFRYVTTQPGLGCESAVIMGRKTWNSLGGPLPGRVSIVVSRTLTGADITTARVASSLDEALSSSGQCPGRFVIGGAELIRAALPHPGLRRIYLTWVRGRFDCDAAIPNLLELGWSVGEVMQDAEEGGVRYSITRMRRA
jgi:dihydrofolate reductase